MLSFLAILISAGEVAFDGGRMRGKLRIGPMLADCGASPRVKMTSVCGDDGPQ